MQNIILFGQMGSGKSTVAKYLCDNYGYTKFSLGEKIHSECELYGIHDREHLQAYGQMMRKVFHENIWCNYLIDRSRGIDRIVIDDARQLNEYDYFTEKGYLPIAVIAEEHIRIGRLQKRVNYVINPESFNHETEINVRNCINKCKIKIYNNTSYEDLVEEIESELGEYLRGGNR